MTGPRAIHSAIPPRDRKAKLTDKDWAALVKWWETGSPEGIERNVLRRLKAARFAMLEGPGRLVLSLAGQRAAAFRAAR